MQAVYASLRLLLQAGLFRVTILLLLSLVFVLTRVVAGDGYVIKSLLQLVEEGFVRVLPQLDRLRHIAL